MPLIINDEKVDDYHVQQEIHSVQAQLREAPDSLSFDSEDEMVEYAKENVICQVLLRQEAAKRIADVPAEEVDKAFAELKEEYGGEEQFYQMHQLDSSHDEEIRGNIASRLKVQKLMDELCTDVPEPTEDEIRAYFDARADEYVYPEQVHASHIVKHPSGPDDEAVYEEMKALRRKALDGEDFATLADEDSDCQDSGGDLGTFAPGQMVEEFETIVFSMDEGEISPVFRTQFGLHIAKVHEKIPPRPCPFEEVKDDIAETLLHDRKNDRIGEFVDEVKKEATIVDLPPDPPAETDEPNGEAEEGTSDADGPEKAEGQTDEPAEES